jgi:hypothetical protein
VGALRGEATTAAQELRAMTTGAGQLANRPEMAKESNGSVLDTDQMSIVGRAEDS